MRDCRDAFTARVSVPAEVGMHSGQLRRGSRQLPSYKGAIAVANALLLGVGGKKRDD